MSTSHRIIIEGFQDATVGYELDVNAFQIKVFGAVKGVGKNYVNVTGDIHLGQMYRYSNDVEFTDALGLG